MSRQQTKKMVAQKFEPNVAHNNVTFLYSQTIKVKLTYSTPRVDLDRRSIEKNATLRVVFYSISGLSFALTRLNASLSLSPFGCEPSRLRDCILAILLHCLLLELK